MNLKPLVPNPYHYSTAYCFQLAGNFSHSDFDTFDIHSGFISNVDVVANVLEEYEFES